MPITHDILENGKVVLVTFTDPWNASQMPPAFEADREHRDTFQQQHPDEKIHLIVDMTQAKIAAQGALTTRRSPSLTHPTKGLIIIVGANSILQTLANAVFRLSHFDRAVFVETLDEALEQVRAYKG